MIYIKIFLNQASLNLLNYHMKIFGKIIYIFDQKKQNELFIFSFNLIGYNITN